MMIPHPTVPMRTMKKDNFTRAAIVHGIVSTRKEHSQRQACYFPMTIVNGLLDSSLVRGFQFHPITILSHLIQANPTVSHNIPTPASQVDISPSVSFQTSHLPVIQLSSTSQQYQINNYCVLISTPSLASTWPPTLFQSSSSSMMRGTLPFTTGA
jgi:hypothetical protein